MVRSKPQSLGRNNDDGFTLVETLVALLVISLTLAALFQVSGFVGRYNHKSLETRMQSQSLKSLERDIAEGLRPLEPIEDDELKGTAEKIVFAGHRIDAKRVGGRFSYLSYGQNGGRLLAVWPPMVKDETAKGLDVQTPRLEAILISDQNGRALGLVKLSIEHSKECQFDMISRNCRKIEAGSVP